MAQNTLVFIPTYNELENVEPLCRGIQALGLPLDILFVDDHSTDGTREVLSRLSVEFLNVHVMQRAGKMGIGSAHLAGIHWAYEKGYAQLVSMDCDFTHPPEFIPLILEKACEGFPIVVGSRYLRSHSLPGWNLHRKMLTRLGHLVTQTLLGMNYDATGGFRCYDLRKIPEHAFDLVVSRGYSFFFESLYIFHRNHFKIGEIPISLPNRTYGHSKMTFAEIKNSVKLLLTTYFKTLFNP